MKKTLFVLVMAAGMMTFGSCNNATEERAEEATEEVEEAAEETAEEVEEGAEKLEEEVEEATDEAKN